jgi:tetratricopeptide (TPR) repeat protein
MNAPNDHSAGDLHQESGSARRPEAQKSQTQLDFELEFFERVLEKQPDYVDALRVHGNNLTAKGRYDRGLDVDRRLVRLKPKDPLVHYNLACSYALLRMTDAAIAALAEALKLGYRDFDYMLRDSDLSHVRHDPRFIALIGRHFKPRKQRRKAR